MLRAGEGGFEVIVGPVEGFLRHPAIDLADEAAAQLGFEFVPAVGLAGFDFFRPGAEVFFEQNAGVGLFDPMADLAEQGGLQAFRQPLLFEQEQGLGEGAAELFAAAVCG